MCFRLERVLFAALWFAVLPAIAGPPVDSVGVGREVVRGNFDPLPELLGMGRILAFHGQLDESTAKFRDAARLYPTNAEANLELGLNLMISGQTNEAARYFSSARQLEPGLAEQNKVTAKTLMNAGLLEAARRRLILACCLKPEDVEARLTLAFCVPPEETWNPGTFAAYLDRLNDAFYQFEKTLGSRPAAQSYDRLGSAFASNGMLVEAMCEYREAVRLYPDDANALNALAWGLVTCSKSELRDGLEAVWLATRAVDLTGQQEPVFIGTLAAAYAETGQFSKAVEMAKKARELALSTGQQELAARTEQLLKLYSAGKTVYSGNEP